MAKWKVQGEYEFCNWDTTFQCIFLSDPDNGFCDVEDIAEQNAERLLTNGAY